MPATPLTTLTSAHHSLASHMRRLQGETTKITAEVAAGRLHDVGLELGGGAQALVAFRQEITALHGTIDANGQLAARLDASQAALGRIVGDGNAFLAGLMSARGDAGNADILAKQAEEGLKAFVESVNTSFAGVYVFGSLEAGTPPMSDYFASPAPLSRQAMDTAFQAEFGIPATDAGVRSIPASSMQAFADNAFQTLFDDSGWSANWTPATAQPVTSLIASERAVASSVTARSEAFRNIAAAFVLVADGGTRNLNEAAYEAVIDKATRLLGEGLAQMGELQGELGTVEKQVDDATLSMKARVDLVSGQIGKEESVDLPELSARLSTLLNQLEATYAVTGRLQQLSLLNAL